MIEALNLSKFYGHQVAIQDVSFQIQDRTVVGLLGLNGAGKSTILKILSCYLIPSFGYAVINGERTDRSHLKIRRQIGFLPDRPPLYPEMKVRDYVNFVADLNEVEIKNKKKFVDQALDLADLSKVSTKNISSLSHGFRQRVGLAGAIVHQPSLLILDEPTQGLDPLQIVQMRKLIQQLSEKSTVVVSSHILSEVSSTCKELILLREGELAYQGSITEFIEGQQERTLHVEVLADSKEAQALTKKLLESKAMQVESIDSENQQSQRHLLNIRTHAAPHEIVGFIVGHGGRIEAVRPQSGIFSEFVQMTSHPSENKKGKTQAQEEPT